MIDVRSSTTRNRQSKIQRAPSASSKSFIIEIIFQSQDPEGIIPSSKSFDINTLLRLQVLFCLHVPAPKSEQIHVNKTNSFTVSDHTSLQWSHWDQPENFWDQPETLLVEKMFDPNLFRPKMFSAKKVFGQKLFGRKKCSVKKMFDRFLFRSKKQSAKTCFSRNVYRPKNVFGRKNVRPKIFRPKMHRLEIFIWKNYWPKNCVAKKFLFTSWKVCVTCTRS